MIDTTTGIPLDDSSVVQQIPLGGQIFPFADWDATARPTRAPIYGDDVLPTSALVAGQLPTQPAAQSVYTDGNHALLVSDVNASGGGGYTANAAPYLANSVARTSAQLFPAASGTGRPYFLDPVGRYIYGITGYMYISDANNNNPIILSVILLTGDLAWELWLGDFIRFKSATNDQERTYNFSLMFPNPIDMLASHAAYDGTIGVNISVNVDHVDGLWGITILNGN